MDAMRRHDVRILGGLAVALLALGACRVDLDDADIARSREGSVIPFFNVPGTIAAQRTDNYASDILVQMIDQANASIDFAIMGFSRDEVIDALERAWHRGVELRFVGDASHLEHPSRGYRRMDELGVPMVVGNTYHIMHDKFFVIDGRYVVTGTGNITPTGFERNDNNWVLIDSPQVAADFTDEFEQMFGGLFGHAKERADNGNVYQVGDTTVEVYFSPQEDAMGRILEAIEDAKYSVHFYIFAFTKDQVGSGFVGRHLEFEDYNRCCDPTNAGDLSDAEASICAQRFECAEPFVEREVRGVIDRSQLHSNGPYHEAYRLITWDIDMRLDGNETARQPGDYQAGGGRQHSKTLIIDAGTDDAVVLTGSFNWSSSATVANDETLVVLHGADISNRYLDQFEQLWDRAFPIGVQHADPGGDIEPGDVIFNEIHWDGWNGDNDPSDFGGDDVSNDEFIELLNTTDQTIDLSMWTVATDEDFVVGLYPGTKIGPYERFLLLDHNLEPYQDLVPQDFGGAFENGDFVMNSANDPRFLRLNLHNAQFRLRLLDPRGNVIDEAGDGGPPFVGGRNEEAGGLVNRSMERAHPVVDGSQPAAWRACSADQGGANVREEYRSRIIATPGEPNSGGEPGIGDEDPYFRTPSGQR